MQIGIIGLLHSGKSTLFSTLLSHQSIDSASGHHMGTERGVIKVPDERLERLTEMFNPEKKVNATIEYLKVPGLEKETNKGDGLPPQFLANVKTVDLIHIFGVKGQQHADNGPGKEKRYRCHQVEGNKPDHRYG